MRLGEYELEVELGRGAAGSVWRARSPSGAVVAIKRLHRPDPGTLARFEREKRLLVELGSTPGFVPILGSGETQGAPWFVMPLLEGGTLRDRLRLGRLADDETRRIGRKLAAALAAAHERGVVHRDLKPENILFTDRAAESASPGEPLIADLGLAKHFVASQSQSMSASLTGVFRGTAGYMPPEQMRDAKAAGPAADVFALGAILYECATGTPAFHGASVLDLISKVEAGERVPVRRARADIPPDLEAAIEKALAHDPAQRPADGRALGALLRAAEKRAGRRVAAVTAVLLVIALLVAGGAFLASRESPAKRARALYAAAAADTSYPASSIALLDQAIELDPGFAEARGRRAAFHDARGYAGRALADAERALELDRGCFFALVVLAERAVVSSTEEEARELIRRAMAAAPSNARPYCTLANLEATHRRMPAARAALARARALAGDDPDCTLGAAVVLAVIGDFDEASAVVDRVARAAPDRGSTHATRGWVAIGKGDYARAFEEAERSLAYDPTSVTATILAAVARKKTGANDEAIRLYTRAIELEPGSVVALCGRADTRLSSAKRDPDAALPDLDRALALAPDCGVARATRAVARYAKGDVEGAHADGTRAVQLYPEYAIAWHTLGAVAFSRDDATESARCFTRALELDPGATGAWKDRARARLKLGDMAGAIAHLDEAIARNPGDVSVWIQRASARAKVGDGEGAASDLEKALALGVAEPNATKIREQIAVLRARGR